MILIGCWTKEGSEFLTCFLEILTKLVSFITLEYPALVEHFRYNVIPISIYFYFKVKQHIHYEQCNFNETQERP